MEKEGFIYLWYDKKHKKYYLGCHWGTLDDGYVCSSKWMRKSFNRRPEDFKRRILQRGLEKNGLKEHEVKWLSLIKTEELGKRYYNLSKILTGSGWKKGTPRSEETKRKLSEAAKKQWKDGKGFYGIKRSEELKSAWSKQRKGVCKPNSGSFQKGTVPWNIGSTGRSWYTNGTLEVMRTECPDGFYKGRLRR